MTNALSVSEFTSNNRSEINFPFLGSKFPVGSSANNILAEHANALAIATLCCSPPDKFNGL